MLPIIYMFIALLVACCFAFVSCSIRGGGGSAGLPTLDTAVGENAKETADNASSFIRLNDYTEERRKPVITGASSTNIFCLVVFLSFVLLVLVSSFPPFFFRSLSLSESCFVLLRSLGFCLAPLYSVSFQRSAWLNFGFFDFRLSQSVATEFVFLGRRVRTDSGYADAENILAPLFKAMDLYPKYCILLVYYVPTLTPPSMIFGLG